MISGPKSRSKKLIDNIVDVTCDELQEIAKEGIHAVINDVKEWVIHRYSSFFKSDSKKDTAQKLKELQNEIAISNTYVEIGMRQKEIAVMWAMKRLGYSEEETQQILDLANGAYQLKK